MNVNPLKEALANLQAQRIALDAAISEVEHVIEMLEGIPVRPLESAEEGDL